MSKKILAVVLAFFYSIVYIVAGPAIQNQSLSFNTSQILPFLLTFVLCSAVNILIFSVIPHCRFHMGSKRISQYIDKIGDRKFFFIIWAFIFVSWIPAYFILYPGVLSYDILSQVDSALNGITNNHHPVLHTWLIRVFMNLGDSLFSGYEYGIGLLSLLQMVILSYALARLVMLLKKKKVPILIVLFTALLSAIWFMNACLAVTMIKDTLHAAFLVLFVCHFTEIAMNPVEYSRQKRNLIFLPIIIFLMCAFRNNGIHIYIFCIAALSILRISQIKKIKNYLALTVVLILPVIVFKIYTGPFFASLGIEQGEVREALCIPIQQLQRVSINKSGELTSEQRKLMNYYIDNLEWGDFPPEHKYSPFFADHAKSCFYSEHYKDNPIAFWEFYLQTGKQFTKEYIVAFLSNTLGDWYPGEYRFSYVMYDNYPSEMFTEPLERKSIWNLQILKDYYESVCSSDFWRETPGIRLFFVPGFTLWFLIYGLLLAWKKRGFFTNVLPLYLPLIAQYGIMILSPMSSFRYAWPFYLILPLSFIGILGNTESIILKDNSDEALMEKENDT